MGACTKSAQRPTNLVTFFSSSTQRVIVNVEVVQSAVERQRGLMERHALAPHHGMLFIFDTMADHPFWMKQTVIALDMIFIDNKQQVIGIIHDVPPLTLERRTINKPSQYVVEVPAGYARANNITVGTKAAIQLAKHQFSL